MKKNDDFRCNHFKLFLSLSLMNAALSVNFKKKKFQKRKEKK